MSKRVALIAIAALLLTPRAAWAQLCPVSESGDLLEAKLPAIKAAIPRRFEATGRDGFMVPTATEMAAWRPLVAAMIQGNLASACGIIAANTFPYRVVQYSDGVTGKTYDILQEEIPPLGPIAKGWGTYLFNRTATTLLSIQVPHPLFDDRTPEEGVDAFRQLDARTLLMAGAHRYANSVQSSCQPDPGVVGNNADVAHNIENMFEPAHEVIAAEIPGTAFIQLHGNQRSTCDHLTGQPDVVLAAFVSNGTTTPGPSVNQIVDCMNIGLFVAEAATAGSECIFKGTTNIQGRFSNGSPDLCSRDVDAASEKFIHIEQSQRSGIRDPANRQALIDALRCALVP